MCLHIMFKFLREPKRPECIAFIAQPLCLLHEKRKKVKVFLRTLIYHFVFTNLLLIMEINI